jgi:hypothetical protein
MRHERKHIPYSQTHKQYQLGKEMLIKSLKDQKGLICNFVSQKVCLILGWMSVTFDIMIYYINVNASPKDKSSVFLQNDFIYLQAHMTL